ncbi:transketolase [Candidatus Epulonipiscium viviparus]|uniref:transketolase n=1 Tax=Candidatus Epulonipiscium viviparus TaxID=420336 RepID=UPI0027381396|nr:transketolase [Candidatus Epulopiscium viviparus]
MESDIKVCNDMRRNLLEMAYSKGNSGAHIGAGLSIIEILKVIYFDIKRPNDCFILSKGHGGIGYYTVLYEAGLITKEQLFSFGKDGGILSTHPSKNLDIGIECSTGSLGMGLSFGIGKALAARITGADDRVYVLLGDGECNEGSVWEAAMFAGSAKLTNLIAIVDANKFQLDGPTAEVLSCDLPAMWAACGWSVTSIDGNNCDQLREAFSLKPANKPLLVYANTIKGKGISFMEANNEWHHTRLVKDQLDAALAELNIAEVDDATSINVAEMIVTQDEVTV